MPQIWAISTNKGGVLKTSITTNLAGILAQRGKRVLIVDTDNQGNCAISFGINPDGLKPTLYDVLIDGAPAEKAIVQVHNHIDLLPANDDMQFFDFDVLGNHGKFPKPFTILKDKLAAVVKNYDYVLVDTPPNLGVVQGNVLTFVEQVLIPFQPETYSQRSLIKIVTAIKDFHASHNPKLSILGVLATLVDFRTTLHTDAIQECRRYCAENGIRMFDTVIPKSVRFASTVAYERKPATLTADVKKPIVSNYYELLQEVESK